MQQETRIGALIIDSKPIQNANREPVSNIICEAAKKTDSACSIGTNRFIVCNSAWRK